jgi:alpha-L-rhamnosidase
MKMKSIFLFLIGFLLLQSANSQLIAYDLQCELLSDPLGIDVTRPRLSWKIQSDQAGQRNVVQTAYHIMVASTPAKLEQDEADIWNSGIVNSSQSRFIEYGGKPLGSRATCYWKVKVYTNKGETHSSPIARWTMGLLNPTDWKAKWIGYDKASPWDSVTQWSRLSARYLRKTVSLSRKVKDARVYAVGLGLYQFYINGTAVTGTQILPAPTDYRKSVLYNTFDVTETLNNAMADSKNGGKLVLGVVLGNGRYFTMRQNYKPQKINTFGFPKLLLQLEIEFEDGSKRTIISDESWRLNVNGPIKTNNEYDGEEYDATKELGDWKLASYRDTAKWMKPQIVSAPEGKLKAQMIPPVDLRHRIMPVAVHEKGNGRYIVDMGQNFAGVLAMHPIAGKRGKQVKFRYAESLQPNGELYTANLRDARVTDIYTFKGVGAESWYPAFVYHGFRYVEITGFPLKPDINSFTGFMVNDEMGQTGSFLSSDSILGKIHTNAWYGILSNYKGMPVDCPQRNERQPWLGDRATGAAGEAFLFNNAALYAKWLNDIGESQTAEGAIPDVAPAFWNYYSDNMTWPGTYLLIADMLYRQYGDKQPIVEHYPSMKKWMNYMKEKYMKDYILTKDKYGDWCVPPESLELIRSTDSTRTTKGALISTAYYYWFLQSMKRFAILANHPEDMQVYDELAGKVKRAFQQTFYNSQKKFYDNNTVTANLLPLYFGITPDSLKDAVFNNLYNRIKLTDKMHISTGVIGTQWLMRGLSRFQRSDIAFTIASNRTYPSWGYMTDNGATTIWELWNGNTASPQMNSQNHVMLLGDLLIWMYEDLAGIKSDERETGFKRIIMKPDMIDGLKTVGSTYYSPYGKIWSYWFKDPDGFFWNIEIPCNSIAEVYIPANNINEIKEGESPMPVSQAEGVKFLRMEGHCAVFEVGSGKYKFTVNSRFRQGIVSDQFIFQRASFPESHAATIAETPDGLIAAWFGGTKEGYKDVCIWTSRLVNNRWTEPIKVADGVINDSVRYPCYNPVLHKVPGGELLLFYKIGPNVAGWTGWMMRSKDNGRTWSAREALPAGFLGPIKNKPVMIDGKLVCGSSTERNGWKVHFEISPDFGKTWYKTDSINDGKIVSAIQPSILEYADGRLQVMCRSKNRTINESWSTDRGKTWSPMAASPLPNNNSGTDAVTLKDGRQLLVYNHVKPDASLPNGKGARTPLNVAVTKDGKNWEAALILEDSPVSQYSYPSVIQTKDGMVHIVYTWRRERIKHVVVDPAKLKLEPIVNEQWPGVQTASLKPSDD